MWMSKIAERNILQIDCFDFTESAFIWLSRTANDSRRIIYESIINQISWRFAALTLIGILVVICCAAVILYAYWSFITLHFERHRAWSRMRGLVTIMFATFAPVALLMSVAADWGRFIHIWVLGMTVFAHADMQRMCRDAVEARRTSFPGHSESESIFMVLAVISLSGSLIYFPHCCVRLIRESPIISRACYGLNWLGLEVFCSS
jgi:hypothetical protein